MPGLKITLLQQPLVWMDGPANLRHFDRQLEGITGRDVIVLPEMFTSGFAMEAAKQSLPEADVVEWMHARAAQSQALIAGSAALQTIFGVLQGIAGDIQSGLLTVVAPIAIAVCLYFLVRMLLASDAKDVATYRKRCITTAIIVVVAFTIPGLISVMKNLGTVINGQL